MDEIGAMTGSYFSFQANVGLRFATLWPTVSRMQPPSSLCADVPSALASDTSQYVRMMGYVPNIYLEQIILAVFQFTLPKIQR